MKQFTPIVVDKEGVSDDFYVVVAVFATDGQEVVAGDLLLCFETSKAAIDVEAPHAGYYFGNVAEGDRIVVGDTLAVVSKEPTFDGSWFSKSAGKPTPSSVIDGNIRVSKKAQKLIDESNLSLDVFGDKSIISVSDVEEYLSSSMPEVDLGCLEINENSVIVYGAGGHAHMCLDLLRLDNTLEVLGMVDSKKRGGEMVMGARVLGSEALLEKLFASGVKNAVLGIGAVLNHQVRGKLYQKLLGIGFRVPNLIHPSTSIEQSVTMGQGNQLMQGAIVGSNATIGNNCIINSGCVVSHDCVIEDNVHIAPGAILAGGVTVRQGSVVGMGVTVFLGVNIGENVIITNGINVFSDVPDGTTVKSQEV